MKIDLKQLKREAKKTGYRALAKKYNCSIATISRLLNDKSKSKSKSKSKGINIVNIRKYSKVHNTANNTYYPLWLIDSDYQATIYTIARYIYRKYGLTGDINLAVEYTIDKCYTVQLDPDTYKSYVVFTLRSYLFNHYSKTIALSGHMQDIIAYDTQQGDETYTPEYTINSLINSAKRTLAKQHKAITIDAIAILLMESYPTIAYTYSLKRLTTLLRRIID